MLSHEELKEFTEFTEEGKYCVSLYLNVSPVTNPAGEYITHLKNMVKEVSESTEKDILSKVKSDIGKLQSHVASNKREFKRQLVLFSSDELDLWREYNLSVPLKNLLVIDRAPFIKPLLDIADNYSRALILLVDKENARIFTVQLGEITEYGDLHTSDIPGKHKKGGWFALSETHYRRHIDYHVTLHLKDVAKKIESFITKEKINVVFLAGADEAVTIFKDLLSDTVRSKLAGQFSAEMTARPDEILKLSKPALSSHEALKEKEIVEELITRSMKGEQSVLGIEGVLQAARERKINTLVFVKDYRESGLECRKCGALTARELDSCPYCEGEVEHIEYMVDLVAQKAVEQGSAVKVLSHEGDLLSEKGGIGAILRF